MKSLKLKIATTIAAKPDAVFAALTDPKTIGQWSGQKGKVASSVGGAFEMFDGWVKRKSAGIQAGKNPGVHLAYRGLDGGYGSFGCEVHIYTRERRDKNRPRTLELSQ